MKATLLSPSDKSEYDDMRACYEAIKKARLIRKKPVNRRKEGATYTNIPMEMWEVLQPVIEVIE